MKQAILVRTDLKMGKGKIAAQVAHASVEAVSKSTKEMVSEWKQEGMKKVVLKVSSRQDLIKYNQEAKDIGLKTALIQDAAMTQLASPDITCLAIGPDNEEKVDKITKNLKLL